MPTPSPPPPPLAAVRSVSSASPTNIRNLRRNEGAEGRRPPPRRAKSNDSSSIPRPRPGVPRSRTAESASKWVRTNSKARGMEGSSREFDYEGSTTNIPALSLGAWKSQDDDEEHSDNSMSYLPSHQHDMSWRSAVPQRLLDTPSSHQRGSSARTNSRESESSSNMNDTLSNLSMSSVKDAADTTKTHPAIGSALGGYRSDDDLKWLEDDDDTSSSRSHSNLNDSISKNMFQALEDLRQVDQSVNLMDPQKAKYEHAQRNNNSTSYISGLSQFLKERDRRDKNWDLYHLKSTSTGKRSSGGCLRIFCNLPFLIMVAFMAAAVLIHTMWHNSDRAPSTTATTGAVNIAPDTDGTTTTTTPNFTSTTTSPTQRTKALEALLEDLDPKFDIVSTASPAAREAFTWITAYDPAQVDLSLQKEKVLIERFVLATLFFATHPQYNAASSNFVAGHHHATTQVVEDTTTAEQEDAGRRQRRHLLIRNHLQHWMTGFSVCQWEGITCHHDRVTTISLAGAQLQGTIPPEIGMLGNGSFLKELDLSDNKLEGTVPDTMRQMTSLESLRLEHNTLTGDISTVVCPLKKRDQANLTFVSSDCDWRVKCGGNNNDDHNDDDGCCDKCY